MCLEGTIPDRQIGFKEAWTNLKYFLNQGILSSHYSMRKLTEFLFEKLASRTQGRWKLKQFSGILSLKQFELRETSATDKETLGLFMISIFWMSS